VALCYVCEREHDVREITLGDEVARRREGGKEGRKAVDIRRTKEGKGKRGRRNIPIV
jgi:hypothetical protein